MVVFPTVDHQVIPATWESNVQLVYKQVNDKLLVILATFDALYLYIQDALIDKM